MLDIKILRNPAELTAIEVEWSALHDAAQGSPFSHIGWQKAWLEVYLDDCVQPIVITAWEDGVLIAVAPFAIRQLPISKFKRYRPKHLTMLAPDRTGFHDFLALPGREAVFSDIFKACMAMEGINYIDLSPMKVTPAFEAFCQAAQNAGCWMHRRDEITTCIADLSEGWDHYVAGRSSATRKGIRANQRKIARQDVKVRIYDQVSESGLDDVSSISRRSWKAKGGTDIGSDEQHRRYIEKLFEIFAPDGHFVIFVLYLDGLAVSSSLEIVLDQTCYALISDYDDTYAKAGVGRYITEESIRLNQERGVKSLDFLRSTHFTKSYADKEEAYQRLRISTRFGLTQVIARAERILAQVRKKYGSNREKLTGRRLIIGDRSKR